MMAQRAEIFQLLGLREAELTFSFRWFATWSIHGWEAMILNRIANAIRKQDWFTVLLEFVIVVFGIFVGLQATEWEQERQDCSQS